MDVDRLDNGLEDTSAELGMSRETDDHESSSRAEVVNGLLVSSRGGSGDDSSVSTETVSSGDDILDEVLGLLEVDPLLSTERQDEVFLLGTSVDGEDTEAHSGGVLDSQVAESSSGTGEDDPFADPGVAVFDGAVDGYTLSKGNQDLIMIMGEERREGEEDCGVEMDVDLLRRGWRRQQRCRGSRE